MGRLTGQLTGRLTGWLTGRLTGWLTGQGTGWLMVQLTGWLSGILKSASMYVLVSVCIVRTECLRSCCVGVVGGRGVFVRSAQQNGHSRTGLPESSVHSRRLKTLVFLGVVLWKGRLLWVSQDGEEKTKKGSAEIRKKSLAVIFSI